MTVCFPFLFLQLVVLLHNAIRPKKAKSLTCGGESSLFSSASSFNLAGTLFLPPIKAGIEILKSRDFLRFLDFRFLGEDLDGDLEGDLDGEGAGEGECLPLPTDSS